MYCYCLNPQTTHASIVTVKNDDKKHATIPLIVRYVENNKATYAKIWMLPAGASLILNNPGAGEYKFGIIKVVLGHRGGEERIFCYASLSQGSITTTQIKHHPESFGGKCYENSHYFLLPWLGEIIEDIPNPNIHPVRQHY